VVIVSGDECGWLQRIMRKGKEVWNGGGEPLKKHNFYISGSKKMRPPLRLIYSYGL
jgi:hypothetical protein